MKSVILCLKVSLLACLFINNGTHAETISAWGNENLPPMAYMEGDVPKGFGIEIIQAVLDEAKVDFRFKMAPWKRAYIEAKRGQGLVFGMYFTKQRAKIFDFSKPIWSEEIVLVTRKGQEFPFNKIADLKGKRISLQRGTRPGTEFEDALKNKLFIALPNNSPVERVGVLMHGQIDAAIFNPGIASVVWNAHQAGIAINNFSVLKKPLAVKAKHIGILKSLHKSELMEKINTAIDALNQRGVIQGIMKRYETLD